MSNISITATEKDSEMWDEDNIQIMIDSTPDTETDYYHITINPIGTVYDQEISSVNIERSQINPTPLGKGWDFGGSVDTDIRDNFWTVEMSIPFASFAGTKPKVNDVWRLNFYRIEQQRKEYTYWSPTYSTPDLPHVPSRFGELIFSDIGSLTKTSEKLPLPSESALAIMRIIIEGNDKISEKEITDALNMKNGDLADVDVLSSAKLHLESLGWFQNIGMELIQNDKGVDLVVKITEKEIISPVAVVVEGATVFTKDELVKYFNLTPSMTTIQDVAMKCKLINELYKVKDYEMASAKYSVVSNTLHINIDEGRIDGIEVHGNNKIKTKDIMDSLAIKSGMPYKRNDIDNAVNDISKKLPYFSAVNWKPKKSDDGSNIVVIEVKESSLIKPEFDNVFEFNRVHGLQLGLKPGIVSTYWGSRAYFGFSYGFSSEIWNYQFGAEKSFFRHNKITIGFDVHKITDTNDREIISDGENFIAEAILGEAFRDYYQRDGFEVSLSQEIPFDTKLGVKYRDDIYDSLSKTNDWSLLNRFYDNENDRSIKHKRDNPDILEGRMKSVIGEAVFDTRNSKKSVANGWYNRLSIEYAGENLGGDYDFTIYQADIRRYNRLSENQLLLFRVKVATADRELPRQHPKKLYLGGVGTLRGYSYKEFAGDKMLLMNAEYWLTVGGFGIVLFADSGYAWKYGSEMITDYSKPLVDDLRTDVGAGLSLGSMPGNFIINVAMPIEEGNREPVISIRLDRMF
jgi:outer membrane protein insertion porin family